MLLNEICQVGCKIESVEGTDEFGAGTAPAGADIFLAFNPKFTPEIDMNKRRPARATLSPYTSLPGARSAKMSFDVEIVGGEAAGHAIGSSNTGSDIGLASALVACGVQQTLVVATSATYKPYSIVSGAPPLSNCSVSLAMMLDGKMCKLWGARGTAKITLEVGKPGIISFEFTGADWSEEDKSLVAAAIDYNTETPPVFQDVTLTIGAYSAILSKAVIDLGNKVTLRKDASAPSGNLSAIITSREPTLSFDPENPLNAINDFLGDWKAGSDAVLSAAWGTTPSAIELTCGHVQYQSVSLADREGGATYEIQALLVGESGDDEWQLAIT
jgi:hypothetical protein